MLLKTFILIDWHGGPKADPKVGLTMFQSFS